MHKPILIHADPTTDEATHKTIKQIAFQSHKLDRLSAVARILQSPQRDRVIVFTRTKRTAAYLAKDLTALGFQVAPVHGGMKQQERNKALHDFRTGAISILIATDVAARGIDIAGVSHVINYQVPEDERTYVHRIGRTGRAGSSGVAITLVGWDEVDRWNSISDLLKLDLTDPPQWFSSSTEFLNTFHLPHDINDHVGDPANASLSHGRE